MAEAQVRGVTLTYEIVGDHGPWIALTPGSRRSYDELVPLAKLFAAQGYRVLLHDRRNCGDTDDCDRGRPPDHSIRTVVPHAVPTIAPSRAIGLRLRPRYARGCSVRSAASPRPRQFSIN